MAIGAYGIINRVLTLFVMIIMGLTMGMQPIIGYNYGSNQMKRVKQTLKIGIATGVGINTIGFFVCVLFPHAISSIFTNEESLIEIAASGLRISILIFPLVGSQIVISNFFQSIGKAKVSVFLSLSRQLLYLLPCLLLFPHFLGTNGVWWSMVVSDFLAFVTAALILDSHFKKINKRNSALV